MIEPTDTPERVPLLLCPFCGNNPVVVTNNDRIQILCGDGNCTMVVTSLWNPPARAIAAWNRRATPPVAAPSEDTARALAERGLTRDFLGERVREAWVRWAEKQTRPKPHWLTPWNELNESDREADRQIGSAIALFVIAHPIPASEPLARLQRTTDAWSPDEDVHAFQQMDYDTIDHLAGRTLRAVVPCAYCEGTGVTTPGSPKTGVLCNCRSGQRLRVAQENLRQCGTDLTDMQMVDVVRALKVG